ncbi:universal stress protein [Halorubrum laminariae]|uniref:Universal stress protein n=1 Tax=Halorubrum laminariae TaxID=1433523 RepID=A0ABD6C3Z9_9EURY|nr:universal stress protein [Halorubrum laminariae]
MTDSDDVGDANSAGDTSPDDANSAGGVDLLGHALLPVANEKDARATARALEPYNPARVTALHVVEKGGGVPDKTPVEQSEALAEESYAAVRAVFPDADDHTAYGRDVAAEIFAAADAVDATAIVYRSRGGNRIMQILSGDLSLRLVTSADVPVVALPRTEE